MKGIPLAHSPPMIVRFARHDDSSKEPGGRRGGDQSVLVLDEAGTSHEPGSPLQIKVGVHQQRTTTYTRRH